MALFEVRVPIATVWTEPDAPRHVDRPAVLDDPDLGSWTAAMDAEVRGGLKGRILTQLLLGEGVRIVEEQADWVKVVALVQPSSLDPVGYPGWVRRAHLGAPVPREDGATALVTAPSAVCDLEAGPRVELSFGTVLWVDDIDEQRVTVLLPDGRRGVLPLEDVRLSNKGEQPTNGVGDPLADARRFLGLRYLWGGTSSFGLDCSGLVHLVYRAQGVVIPRDAFDQVEAVDPVALDEVRPGDLYFFARPGERVYHVGFVSRPVGRDGSRWMLHAPEGGELIEDAPLALHRRDSLVAAGRLPMPHSG